MKNLSAADLQRVSRLLDEALERPASERLAWLEARRDVPEELRARMRPLFAVGADTYSLPDLPRYTEAELAALIDAPDNGPAQNAAVGPYRLIRELGRGGMGSVWLAERSDGVLKRQVALKLPHSTLARGQLTERFARERDILATLVHPHIARLYDAGVAPDGRPYLAMEYVEGRALPAYCQARELDLAARLKLFQQVVRAIQYAHSQLVVHRDLKPGNILVTAEGYVRLLDFGIAKLLEDSDRQSARLTEFEGRALTPQYAAPEQILGRPIGTGADIYTLGLLLYELLTGTPPYRLKRDTRGALENAILEAEPVLPSVAAKGHTAWAKSLAGDLDTIILKALKKDPAERYATAAAFAEDIDRYLKGEPVLARPDSLRYRAAKFLRRHRWPVAAVASIVLALAAGLGAALWQADIARKQARTAQAAEAFMSQVFWTNSFMSPDPKRARETTARELLDIGAQAIDRSLADAPQARLRMLSMFAKLYAQLDLRETAVDFMQRCVDLARELHGRDSDELLDALGYLAGMQRAVSVDHPGQQAVLDEAEAILARRGERDSVWRAMHWMMAADYHAERDFPQALAEARQGMSLLQRYAESDAAPHWTAKAARIAWLGGDYATAKAWSEFGLAVAQGLERSQRPGGRNTLPGLNLGLALIETRRNDLTAADRHLHAAIESARRLAFDEFALRARIELAGFRFLTGRGGADLLREVTDEFAQHAATMHPPFGMAASLGRAQALAGQHGAALESLTGALAARSGIDASPAVAEALRDQARAYLGLGRQREAGQALDRAVAMREKAGIRPPDVLREEAVLRARLLLAQDQPAAAERLLAAHAAEPQGPSPAGNELQVVRAEALLAQGDRAGAQAVARQALATIEASPQRTYLARGESALRALLAR